MNRKEILALGVLAVLNSACSSPSFPTPHPTEKPTPKVEPTAHVPPSPRLEPRATATTVLTKGTPQSKAGKAWEIKVNRSQLGNLNPYEGEPPAFLWNGKRLFVNSIDGSVVEVDIKNGRDIEWEWKGGKGYCSGLDQTFLYLASFNGLRLDAFDANSKFKKWDYQIRREFLNSAAAMAVYTPKDIRWPPIFGDFFTLFQFEKGFYAINHDKKIDVQSKGFVVQSSKDRILFTSELYLWGSREWGLFDSANKKYLWTHQPDYKRPAYGAADKEAFVLSLPVKVNPGQPYLDGPFAAEARSMITGDTLWSKPKETDFYTGAALVGKDLVMVGARYKNPNSYWLFNKQNGDEAGRFTSNKENDPVRFISAGEWFLASSDEQGVTAYLNGSERWKNPQLFGLDSLLRATNDQIILARNSGQATVLALNTQDGKIIWPAIDFSQPITSKALVGEKLVIATGSERVGNLSIIDTKNGKRTNLDLNLTAPIYHLATVGTSGVLGQSGNRLLAIRVE